MHNCVSLHFLGLECENCSEGHGLSEGYQAQKLASTSSPTQVHYSRKCDLEVLCALHTTCQPPQELKDHHAIASWVLMSVGLHQPAKSESQSKYRMSSKLQLNLSELPRTEKESPDYMQGQVLVCLIDL